MYVPILATLESIFKSKHMAEMLKNSGPSDSRLRDISDGSFLKTHPLFSTERHTVQIQMFYDDFEVANPLGSKRGIHKLGAILFWSTYTFAPYFMHKILNVMVLVKFSLLLFETSKC